LAEVHAALAHYYDHQAEINRDISEGNAFLKALRNSTPSKLAKRLVERSMVVGLDRGAERASNDADVSSIPPLIPDGGFSPIRLQGWLSDGTFPNVTALKSAPDIHAATPGLHPSFVHFVVTSVARSESGRRPDRAPP
jgi:hypothetical protein